MNNLLLNQPIATKIVKQMALKKLFGHAYLIETNGSNDVNEFVKYFLKALICPNFLSEETECKVCKQIDDNNYIDIKYIEAESGTIKKEQLLNLQKEFSTKSVLENKKIYVIKDAEKMNASTANSILKFLEEPMENIIAVLITDNHYQLLDTINSRCQLIRLRKIANNEEILTTKDYSTEEIANYKNIVKNFIKTYEQKKIEVLAYSQKLWFKEFNDKEKMELGLQIMLYYYLKILDYKHNTSTEDESFIKEIAEKLEMSEICDKILVIDLFKQKIKNNLNLNLLFDNLIITLEKG